MEFTSPTPPFIRAKKVPVVWLLVIVVGTFVITE